MVYLYPRGILADTAPTTLRCWTTISGAHARHRLTRTGPKSFTLEPIERPLLDHSFDQLFRSPDRPFAVGDTIDQCGASITVSAVLHGLPCRLTISFRRNLDDPELGFLVWRDHHLERFTFPALNETVELPWSSGPSNVF
jgi:hypothetical protein